ncbi:MAG: OmpA family protein [Oligoflexales bacterium]|nr:OmpA family protein [Oligoflexales bacterium]
MNYFIIKKLKFSSKFSSRAIFILSLLLFVPRGLAENKSEDKILFRTLSFDFDTGEEEKISKLIEEMDRNLNLTTIIEVPKNEEQTKGYVKFIAYSRGLHVFQELTAAGINPARLQIKISNTFSLHQDNEYLKSSSLRFVKIVKHEKDKAIPFPVLSAEASTDKQASVEDQFVIQFSELEKAIKYDEVQLKSFLVNKISQGSGTLSVEGHSDAYGADFYNRVLSKFRALHVFEKLVRMGFPAKQISVNFFGKSQIIDKKHNRVNRRVSLIWHKKDSPAVVQETPALSPPPPPPPILKKVQEAPHPVASIPEKHSPLFDIIPFAGSLMALGKLGKNVKPTTVFGLGLSKNFLEGSSGTWRVMISASQSKFKPKSDQLTGYLKVTPIMARLDYQFFGKNWHPYFGLGLGMMKWDGSTTVKTDQSRRQEKGIADAITQFSLGTDYSLSEHFFISPELSGYRVWGLFDSSFITATIALRVRI